MSMPPRMTFMPDANAVGGEPIAAHRTRLEVEAEQRAEIRRQQLAELRSDLHTPAARIGIWEKVHDLRLPLDPEHAVLFVVAKATGLTLEEIRQEQQERRLRGR